MDKIEIKILNPVAIKEAEKTMICAARLTQRGHKISSLCDFMQLYEKEYSAETVKTMTSLPHPTIQKFGLINIIIVGASRRFLAQITRHQNEVKFMSASLQYSNYSEDADFVVPYNLLDTPIKAEYLLQCKTSMEKYNSLITAGIDNDSAGYLAPQGLRNVLLISATPYQWKHMINQRVCRRNTSETRYVMLRIWEALYKESPEMFSPENMGPFCMSGHCRENKMSCKNPLAKGTMPTDIIKADFPLLMKGLK